MTRVKQSVRNSRSNTTVQNHQSSKAKIGSSILAATAASSRK